MKYQHPLNANSFLEYWDNEIAYAPQIIQIPTDFSRIQNQIYSEKTVQFSIGPELSSQLFKLEKSLEADSRTVLLSAFGILLYRGSMQNDLVIGVLFDRRKENSVPKIKLPIRFIFRDDPSFREISGIIGSKIKSAIDKSNIFDSAEDKTVTEVKKTIQTFPFHAMFEFKPKLDGSQVIESNAEDTDHFNKPELFLEISEREGSFECLLRYNEDLYKRETIERYTDQYVTLLNSICENTNLDVQKLYIINNKESHLLFNVWNDTKVAFQKELCIHHLFEIQVNKTPEAIAVEFENQQMTYAELNATANKLARFLSAKGAREDRIVSLFVERGIDMIIGLLAISKTGATYLPLDPIYPKARLAIILGDADPVIILSQHSLSHIIREMMGTILFIDDKSAYEQQSSLNLQYGNAKKPAYILHTSGSTGKPKGVPISHMAVINLVNSMTKLLEFTAKEILLAVTTISFDIAELEIYMPLFNGAKLVIASQETATDMELLARKMEQCGATVFQATPVTYKMLLINGWKGKKDLKTICGGEALSKELVRDLLPLVGGVWNSYGPTETTIYSVVKNLTMEDAIGEGYVPIGRPIDNTTLFVLNSKLAPVPIGIPGELFIGGEGVSPGYLNLPEMTEERFIPNQFSDNPDERIYKTGDLVKYLPDGNLVFLNRLDSQVKIRGFRIELGEIESDISQFEDIKDNVVIAREDVPGDKKLVAYYIAKHKKELSIIELKKFLISKIPEYMVPSIFIKMDHFPVTLNGKVDRKSLPMPVESFAQASSDYIAPGSETEKEVVHIISDILKIKLIGINDKFFEIGGNSLVATMLISKIKKNHGIHLSLRTLFEQSSIGAIANEIEIKINSLTTPDTTQNIQHHKLAAPKTDLSPGQKRLWFVENFEPGNRAYNLPFDYKITGELDETVLEKSFQELINRHESLRTVLKSEDGIPYQEVLDSWSFKLTVLNLENLNDSERNSSLEIHSMKNEMHIFDLENGPLFIAKLLKFSTKEWLLLFNMHHAVSDGWSVKILVNELGLIYTALKQEEDTCLPELPINYRDYSVWQNKWLKSEDGKKELDFWISELKGAPDLLQLPMDFQRPKNQTYDGDEVSFILNQKTTDQLRAFSQQNKGTLFVTLLSIFNTLISRYASQEEFLIGIPIAGRIFEEQESLVGMLINNFPVRITPLDQMTFPEMYEMSKRKFFLAYENQKLPIDRIVEELKVSRTPNIPPLFQVMFNLLDMFDATIILNDSMMEMVDKRRSIAQFDLSLHIYESKKSLNCVLEYNTNLFKRGRIERMAGHFMQLVDSIMENPDQKLRAIPLLTQNEKNVVLGDWNATKVDFPENQCIHQLFENQVTKTPDAVAIRDERKQLSYTELNQKANKLARHLHNSGAVEGSLVAICMERSVDILVALLAVQKSGCTYIPLDPIYPKDRLALILEDGNPVIVLTERKILESLPETSAKNIFIEEVEAYQSESDENTGFKVTPETIAYLIYTSGSTGKPKGVQIQQRALVNFISSMAKKPGINTGDIMLAVTTISFDIAGLEMYLPITHGASIFVASHETSMNPDLLMQRIEDTGATILQATPVTFRMLNSAEWGGSKRLKILCGGEAMPKELAFDLVRKCKELWNMYGPTETTVWSTVEKVEINDNDRTGYINLGKPIDNTLIYVLNTEFLPVPVGYPGELFIGGDGLAKGYFNLPEMTKDRFLPDPFSAVSGARMYRTGDLVQQTEEGKLEFLNRVDSQVKIRGFRIELGEIESALTQYPTIDNNVVIVREDTPGDKKLVAYIIKKDNQVTDIADLRIFLKTKIPDYMVPSAFVFIEQFPLTPNGKIDRKVLPPPEVAAPSQSKVYLKPATETEKKLAVIWSEVLKIKQIGIDEDFFEIGGHSMIAVTLMVKIEKELGVRLPLAVLFDHGTIQEMALLLDEKAEPVNWGSLVPIRSKGSKKPLYLVHGAGLNLLLYTTIVAHLDPDQPVFGLQAKGLDGIDEPLYSIEEIAAYYNEEILKVDKSGTYSLAGFSMGGQLAYEMAKQLVEAGLKVSFLGVFDTVSENASDMNIPIFKRYLLRVDRIFHQAYWIIGTFTRMPWNKKYEFFTLKMSTLKKKIMKNDDLNKPIGASVGKQSELPKYLHKVHQANYLALEKYILPPYPGKLHLFRARDQKFYIKEPIAYGWDEFVDEVVIHHIPGEHSTIFAPPNDELFARTLQKCLNERDMN